ncbi:hypothetical protein K440DRAFT_129281 [Wilcoxina mikolae CBS 423.85]|nr:hypothetical protein K440DRAFT_129281 [Wilcoxina mikolae CBS 423.85]
MQSSSEPITGLCCLVCTEEDCQSNLGLGDCMHMPGVIYLPPPQAAPKFARAMNAPPPQSAFEMAPWAIYPSAKNTPQTPPSPQPVQRPPRSKPSQPVQPSQLIHSIQRSPPTKSTQPIRPIQPIQSAVRNSPPARLVQPVQPLREVESELHIQSVQQQQQQQQTPQPTQQIQNLDPLQEFQFSDEEWAALMTPPPLTWGAPYASDSPPHDEFELPEELPLNHHQHLQQQQLQQQPIYHNPTLYGSPLVDEFLQNFLPPDTSSKDRQGWYDFLNTADENKEGNMSRLFGEDISEDDRWFSNMDFGGGGYAVGNDPLGGGTYNYDDGWGGVMGS